MKMAKTSNHIRYLTSGAGIIGKFWLKSLAITAWIGGCCFGTVWLAIWLLDTFPRWLKTQPAPTDLEVAIRCVVVSGIIFAAFLVAAYLLGQEKVEKKKS